MACELSAPRLPTTTPVSLTKTVAKPKERKESLIEKIRESIDEHKNIFVFSFENMRAAQFKELRVEWADSRFFLGKNKVMRVALGRDEDEEFRDGLAALGEYLSGNVGLLFTNRGRKEVTEFFGEYSFMDFARSGFEATDTVSLEAGPVKDMQHTMTETLTKLGMPVVLDRGIVTLTKAYTICNAGDALTPEQARLLKLFGHQMSAFKITPEVMWSDGTITELFTAAGAGAE